VISFPDAVRRGFQQYATFSGRANRPEYWWWVLFVWLVDVVASILDGIVGTGIGSSGYYGVFGLVVGLALLVPNIAVSIRRLHDTNKSGSWSRRELPATTTTDRRRRPDHHGRPSPTDA